MAWTDIFGDHPLPGYQRTYYSAGANSLMAINGVTTTMEHERQMDWQVQNGFVRAMGYLFPEHTFRYEMHGLAVKFLASRAAGRAITTPIFAPRTTPSIWTATFSPCSASSTSSSKNCAPNIRPGKDATWKS